jgi:hypothetical protein
MTDAVTQVTEQDPWLSVCYDLHSAVWAALEPERDDLLWCEVSFWSDDGKLKWKPSINCHHKATKCRNPHKPALCYAWEVDSRECGSCDFRQKLERLTEKTHEVELLSQRMSPSLLSVSTQHFLDHPEDVQPYYSHDSIDSVRWIREKPWHGGGDTKAAEWESLRRQVMPKGITGVVIPLTVHIDHRMHHAGGIIVCGKRRSKLWHYLPAAKSAAISLLEQWRRQLTLLNARTRVASDRLLAAYVDGFRHDPKPFWRPCAETKQPDWCRHPGGPADTKEGSHHCDCFYLRHSQTRELLDGIESPDFDKAMFMEPIKGFRERVFEVSDLVMLLSRCMPCPVASSGLSKMQWPFAPGIVVLLGLLNMYDAQSGHHTQVERVEIEVEYSRVTVWFRWGKRPDYTGDLTVDDGLSNLAAAYWAPERRGHTASAMWDLAFARHDCISSGVGVVSDLRSYFAGQPVPPISPVFSKDAIGFTWRFPAAQNEQQETTTAEGNAAPFASDGIMTDTSECGGTAPRMVFYDHQEIAGQVYLRGFLDNLKKASYCSVALAGADPIANPSDSRQYEGAIMFVHTHLLDRYSGTTHPASTVFVISSVGRRDTPYLVGKTMFVPVLKDAREITAQEVAALIDYALSPDKTVSNAKSALRRTFP